MSFKVHKTFVEEGDTVMLYLGRNSLVSIQIDINKTHQTKFGAFPHKEFIGKTYGTKMYSKNRKGWIYILYPSPELWTVTLPHRTQILYSTDISLITMELELKPGAVVVESGTGSGSLSHAIIRTVKPNGHLYTYDFHEQRVHKAREEFVAHGIGEFVTCNHADACKDGFSIEDKADAVFLDLPAPWEAVPHAKKALKSTGGRICSFSPCIEQVQRTCDELRKHRFFEVKTVECLLRPLNVRTVPFPEANLGPNEVILNVKAEKTVVCNSEDCTQPDLKKSKLEVLAISSSANVPDTEGALNGVKENRLSSEDVVNKNEDLETESITPLKECADTASIDWYRKCNHISGVDSRGVVSKFIANTKKGNINVLTSKSNKEMPGHTGYLTFASLFPVWSSSSEE